MKVTIRVNQTGWVVYFDNNVDKFHVFRSDEPERFVRFIAERVGNTTIDYVITARAAEIARAAQFLEKSQ